MDVVLIPAYEPEAVLVPLVEELKSVGLSVLVVDDGSGEKYTDIFETVSKTATVLHLPKNSGKGAALKTGIRHVLDHMPECEHLITCDADGQHKVEDVIRVREQLHRGEKFVLTVRKLRHDIPLRSKIGNNLSRFVYALLVNRYLSDNQSGLRGFARTHLEWMVLVEKDNYDYEMNVLYYAAKKGVRITTLLIEAIYIGNNESSHFNPLLDTVRIYRSLFYLARGTLIAFLVSEVLVLLVSVLFGYQHFIQTLPGIAAISYLTNILINKYICFKHTPCYDYWTTLIYTVISYFVYTLGCLLLMYALPGITLWLSYHIVYLVCIPLRYYLHKFIFVAGQANH